MILKTRRCLLSALVALVVSAAVVAQARVYLRWGSVAQIARTLAASGGTKAYEADVTLNGAKGRLAVFSFKGPLDEVLPTLGQALRGSAFAAAGSTTATATLSADGRTVRLVAVQVDTPQRTLVFSLDQSDEEARASHSAAASGALGGLPAYPGSRALFCAEDERAHTAMVVSLAEADAAAAAEYYRASLAAQGWTAALPKSAATAVYTRREETCWVIVQPADAGATCRITVLHKSEGLGY